MTGSPHLHRRNGVLYFRAVVPPELRDRIGRREFRASLRNGRLSEARGKALSLAAFMRRLIEDIRTGAMANLPSDEIFDLTRREFRRIHDDDRRDRLQSPGSLYFGVRPAPSGVPGEDWLNTEGVDPCDHVSAAEAEALTRDKLSDGKCQISSPLSSTCSSGSGSCTPPGRSRDHLRHDPGDCRRGQGLVRTVSFGRVRQRRSGIG